MIKVMYFGKIKKKDWDAADFVVTSNKGKEKHFYFKIEQYNLESDVHIVDTCGRDVPVDLEHLDLLIAALSVFHAEGNY